jgi:hypothetical protein
VDAVSIESEQQDLFAMKHPTFGPAYDPSIDHPRIQRQHERIRDYMLRGWWKTLAEIEAALGYPQASISAQLRHLRKPKFGSYRVEKRRREGAGTWEYRVLLGELSCS